MSRYIDAEHAEFRLQCCGTYHGVIAFDTVKAVLNKAPSIDIVFCKECKHRGICFGKLVQGIEVVQLNFCSYGERKDE